MFVLTTITTNKKFKNVNNIYNVIIKERKIGMEIFEKIGEVASQTYKYTTEKADKIAKETKIKMKMNENKSKIEDLYNEIGEAVYRRHIATTKENFDEEIQNACEEIDKISKEIEQQNNELLNLKDRKQCPNCHEKIEKEGVLKMDQKHREYCIRLGNPFMREERYENQYRAEEADSSWVPETQMKEQNWIKNSKKFTN